MSGNPPEIKDKQIIRVLDKYNNTQNSEIEHKTKVKRNPIPTVIASILFAWAFITLASNFGIFLGTDVFFTSISILLLEYGNFWAQYNIGRLFIIIVAFLFCFNLYIEIIRGLFTFFLNSNFEKNIERITKKGSILIFLLAIILMPNLLVQQGIEINEQEIDFAFENSFTRIPEMFASFKCLLDVSCIRQKELEKQADQSEQTEYRILFTKPDTSNYKLIEIINGQPRLYLDYQVQAKGGDMFLEKLECYYGSEIKGDPFDIVNLDSRDVTYKELTRLSAMTCDLSKLKEVVKEPGVIKIKPVLYYTLKTEYDIKIPIINTQELGGLTQDEKERFREKYSDTRPVVSNDIFSEGLSTDPTFPFFYPFEDYLPQIRISLKLENNKESNLGTLKRSVIEEAPRIPSFLTQTNKIEIPYEITAFDDATNIEFLFDKNLNLDSTKTEIVDSIEVKINSEIRRERDLVTITITDDEKIAATLIEEEIIEDQS